MDYSRANLSALNSRSSSSGEESWPPCRFPTIRHSNASLAGRGNGHTLHCVVIPTGTTLSSVCGFAAGAPVLHRCRKPALCLVKSASKVHTGANRQGGVQPNNRPVVNINSTSTTSSAVRSLLRSHQRPERVHLANEDNPPRRTTSKLPLHSPQPPWNTQIMI